MLSKGDPVLASGFYTYGTSPTVYTFKYGDFGAHIQSVRASRGDNQLKESRYIPLATSTLPSEAALMRDDQKVTQYFVPVTDPTQSIRYYWVFRSRDGKVVFEWQKTEYTLDNGTVKTIASADKNVSSALLLGGSTTATSTHTAALPIVTAVPEKKGWFASLFDWLFSWL